MAVGSVGATDYSALSSDDSSSERKTGMSIDTNTFLQLLVAQLKYQNPLEPQSDTAFVTQLAQMTTLEQMQQMNTTLQNSQAYDMVGKYVYAEVLDTETGVVSAYAGLVNSVIINSGTPYVVVGEEIIAASDVLQVYDPDLFVIPDEEEEQEEEEDVEQISKKDDTPEDDSVDTGDSV